MSDPCECVCVCYPDILLVRPQRTSAYLHTIRPTDIPTLLLSDVRAVAGCMQG